jgi:hypothetical protein
MDFVLSLQGRILEHLLFLTFLEHCNVNVFSSKVILPATWVGSLFPFSVLDPNSSVSLIFDWKSSFSHFFIPLFDLSLHKVSIILVSLEPEL